jgi:hypothetical protein
VHGKTSPVLLVQDLPNQTVHPGLAIAFTQPVRVDLIDAAHVFTVLAPLIFGEDSGLGYMCRCPVRGKVVPVKVGMTGPLITFAEQTGEPPFPTATYATAIAFLFDTNTRIGTILGAGGHGMEVDVQLRCDFVIDREKRAVDGEFVRAELSGDRPHGSRYGIQGGLFESWFQLTAPVHTEPDLSVRVNSASAEEIESLGVKPQVAARIVEAARERPFTSAADLQERVQGISARTLRQLRDRLRFD